MLLMGCNVTFSLVSLERMNIECSEVKTDYTFTDFRRNTKTQMAHLDFKVSGPFCPALQIRSIGACHWSPVRLSGGVRRSRKSNRNQSESSRVLRKTVKSGSRVQSSESTLTHSRSCNYV